jgi:hypothetical protein
MSLEHSPARARLAGASHTVDGFCELEQISRSELYKLWKLGLGPRFYYVGSHRRITEEARRDFHAQAEAAAAAGYQSREGR